MDISATLLPVFLRLRSKDYSLEEDDVHITVPNKDQYVSTMYDFSPWEDPPGEQVYLEERELNVDNDFYSENCKTFIHKACSTRTTQQGSGQLQAKISPKTGIPYS